MARFRNPVGLVDIVATANEDIFENRIETTLGRFQPGERIGDLDLNIEAIEFEMTAREANDLGIELHADDLRIGCERACQSCNRSPAEPEDQNPSAALRRKPENRCRDRIPDAMGRDFAGPIE